MTEYDVTSKEPFLITKVCGKCDAVDGEPNPARPIEREEAMT